MGSPSLKYGLGLKQMDVNVDARVQSPCEGYYILLLSESSFGESPGIMMAKDYLVDQGNQNMKSDKIQLNDFGSGSSQWSLRSLLS